MNKLTINDLEPELRDRYRKALRLRDPSRQLPEFRGILALAPAFMDVRRKIRDIERVRMMASPGLKRLFLRLTSPKGKIKPLIEKDPRAAMELCEDVLMKNLDDAEVLKLLGRAAINADMPCVAAEALERVLELDPSDTESVKVLTHYLQSDGAFDDAVKLLHSYVVQMPDDSELKKLYQSATRTAEKMRRGGPAAAGVTAAGAGTENKAGSKSAAILQLMENTIHDAPQAKLVAAELRKILQNADSMDVRKKLVQAYMIMEDFDKAIEEINTLIERSAVYDPMLDKQLEEAEIGRVDKEIKRINRRPPKDVDVKAATAELEQSKQELIFSHARTRLEKYPNDPMLTYELGQVLFSRGEIEKALEMFNESVKTNRCEIISKTAIAGCLRRMNRLEEAAAQLENVLETLPKMDRERPSCAHALAQIREEMGDKPAALKLYREICSIEPRFRNAAVRVRELEKELAETGKTPDGAQGGREK